ncbi:MAG: sugar-binding protein, partial [Kiritimatiellae bacterium]|nr:sugar-binding protein [Kiritimatiellia bacterium]
MMKCRGQRNPWMGVFLIALGLAGWSAAAATNAPMIAAIRCAAVPPVIDGKLGDPAWNSADILTGFIVPVALDIARDPSEARIVFDEKRLYVGLKAYESSVNLMRDKGSTAFGSDNFELMLQPDPDNGTYYHIAVSALGNVYTAKERSPAWKPAMEVKTSIDKECWSAELSIPFADLGMTAPPAGAGHAIRLNVCRTDFANPGMDSKAAYFTPFSSFAILTDLNFHHPETWAEGIMTRGTEAPRMIANRSPAVNLLANPEFDLAVSNNPVAWSYESGSGDV